MVLGIWNLYGYWGNNTDGGELLEIKELVGQYSEIYVKGHYLEEYGKE